MENQKPVLKIFGKNFAVKSFPTYGQLLEITNLQMILTKNQYPSMNANASIASLQFHLDSVDAVAVFSVLLGEDFNKEISALTEGGSFYDLPAMNVKEIVEVYKKDFFPWYKPFLVELYELEAQETKEKGEGEVKN